MRSQKKVKEFLKAKLSTDKKWAFGALEKIYEHQTKDEQEAEHTIDHNGVGFSRFDGEILSSFARQYKVRGTLTEKQMQVVLRRMPAYWKQIARISDEEKLYKLIEA